MPTTEFGSARLSTALPWGSTAASSSSRLAFSGAGRKLTPVTLPPGRPSCAAWPAATRSPSDTTGIADVARSAASVAAAPVAMISTHFSAASSAARRGNSCARPAAWRTSMAISRPSACPRSRRPSRTACSELAKLASFKTVSTPIRLGGGFACPNAAEPVNAPPPMASRSRRRITRSPRPPAAAAIAGSSGRSPWRSSG